MVEINEASRVGVPVCARRWRGPRRPPAAQGLAGDLAAAQPSTLPAGPICSKGAERAGSILICRECDRIVGEFR
jgi:hypothetical protein